MSLTGNVKLRSVSVNGDFDASIAEAVVAEGGAGLPMTTTDEIAGAETGDWTYAVSSEGRTGEVAVNLIDLDDEQGITYSGPAGNAVRVKVANLDVTEGAAIADAADTVTMAVMLNNDVIAFADEGFVAELDVTVEFNVDTYVGGLQSGDVIRVALIGGTEETLDLDVAEGGTIDIV